MDRLAIEREVVSRMMEYEPLLNEHVIKWTFRQGLYKMSEPTDEVPVRAWYLEGFSDALNLNPAVLWGEQGYVGFVLYCELRAPPKIDPHRGTEIYSEPRFTRPFLRDPDPRYIGIVADKACGKIIRLLTEAFPSRAQPIVHDYRSWHDYTNDGLRP